jgi:hypothetical protein
MRQPITIFRYHEYRIQVSHCHEETGAGDGDRTHDIHLGKVALYR